MNQYTKKGLIDLHIHSQASDGSDSPQLLLRNLREAGVRIFALTDHDTIEGVKQLRGTVPDDMIMIEGVEFSCRMEDTPKRWKCHIVGLGCNEENDRYAALLKKAKDMRIQKMHERIDALKNQMGIHLSEEEIDAIMDRPCPGKPHLAHHLTVRSFQKQGIVIDPNTKNGEERELYLKEFLHIITGLLNRLPVEEDYLDPQEAIAGIVACGGTAVWAHPFGEQPKSFIMEEEVRRRAAILKGCGLQAIECYYNIYNQQQENVLTIIAQELNLLRSGGSDYHGRSKKNRLGELGMNARTPSQEELSVLQQILP